MSHDRTPKTLDLLRQVRDGDQDARDLAFAKVKGELRRQARILRGRLRHPSVDSLELAGAAFMAFVGAKEVRLAERGDFFAYAFAIMRNELVTRSRKVRRERPADERGLAELPGPDSACTVESDFLTELDEALAELEEQGEKGRQAALVWALRHYGAYRLSLDDEDHLIAVLGRDPLPVARIVELLGMAQATVYRLLMVANGFLEKRLARHRPTRGGDADER